MGRLLEAEHTHIFHKFLQIVTFLTRVPLDAFGLTRNCCAQTGESQAAFVVGKRESISWLRNWWSITVSALCR